MQHRIHCFHLAVYAWRYQIHLLEFFYYRYPVFCNGIIQVFFNHQTYNGCSVGTPKTAAVLNHTHNGDLWIISWRKATKESMVGLFYTTVIILYRTRFTTNSNARHFCAPACSSFHHILHTILYHIKNAVGYIHSPMPLFKFCQHTKFISVFNRIYQVRRNVPTLVGNVCHLISRLNGCGSYLALAYTYRTKVAIIPRSLSVNLIKICRCWNIARPL